MRQTQFPDFYTLSYIIFQSCGKGGSIELLNRLGVSGKKKRFATVQVHHVFSEDLQFGSLTPLQLETLFFLQIDLKLV